MVGTFVFLLRLLTGFATAPEALVRACVYGGFDELLSFVSSLAMPKLAQDSDTRIEAKHTYCERRFWCYLAYCLLRRTRKRLETPNCFRDH